MNSLGKLNDPSPEHKSVYYQWISVRAVSILLQAFKWRISSQLVLMQYNISTSEICK